MKYHLRKMFVAVLAMPLALSMSACDDKTTTDPVPLDVPTGLQINGTTLSWSAVENASGYSVKVDEGSVTDNATSTTFNLTMTNPDTYTIYVRAYGDEVSYTISDWASKEYTVGRIPDTFMVTVSANNAAYGTVSGGGEYLDGTLVELEAIPNDNYEFVSWSENGVPVSSEADYGFVATRDITLVANFVESTAVNEPVTVAVSANNPSWGSVTGGGVYAVGDTVDLVATPNNNYEFVDWRENNEPVSTAATYSFVATRDITLIANFAVTVIVTEPVTIAVSANDPDWGSVTGGGVYEVDDQVELVAVPAHGYEFVNWTENATAVSTDATYRFTAARDIALVANFLDVGPFTVSVSPSSPDGGTVTGGGEYAKGAQATVTAVASQTYGFYGWRTNGQFINGSFEYTFTVTRNIDLVADFRDKSPITLSVIPNDPAFGSASGSGTYALAENITFVATPTVGYRFKEWQIKKTPESDYVFWTTDNPFTFPADRGVTFESNSTVMAVFERVLTGTWLPGQYGVIVDNGNGVGSGYYYPSDIITVKSNDPAFLKWGSLFVDWRNGDYNSVADRETSFLLSDLLDLLTSLSVPADPPSADTFLNIASRGSDFNMGFAILETDNPDWSGDHSFEKGYTETTDSGTTYNRATPTIDGMYKEQVESIFFDATIANDPDYDGDPDLGIWSGTRYIGSGQALGDLFTDPEDVDLYGCTYETRTSAAYVVVFWLYEYYEWGGPHSMKARVDRVYSKAEIAAAGSIEHTSLSGHAHITIS